MRRQEKAFIQCMCSSTLNLGWGGVWKMQILKGSLLEPVPRRSSRVNYSFSCSDKVPETILRWTVIFMTQFQRHSVVGQL